MYIVEEKPYAIFILGAGGTGSWLCSFLEKMGKGNDVIVIDGDRVEHKNILRQNFMDKDINTPKAESVAIRYNASYIDAFITDTSVFHDTLLEFPEGTIPMLIGCLDNNATRLIAHNFLEEVQDGVWIDGGNAERHGQAFITIKENGQYVDGFESPLLTHEALTVVTGDERRPDQISCAEQSESAPQNVTANVTSATLLFNLIALFLTDGLILTNHYEFDTRTISIVPVMKEG